MSDKRTKPMDIRHAPERVWFTTRKTATDAWMWASREWTPGERAEYVREALVKIAKE